MSNQTKEKYPFEVEDFYYNGFMVGPPLDENGDYDMNANGRLTNYKAKFIRWTTDPGIAVCRCSDGEERLIPSCQLKGNLSELPEQEKTGVLFGQISRG